MCLVGVYFVLDRCVVVGVCDVVCGLVLCFFSEIMFLEIKYIF